MLHRAMISAIVASIVGVGSLAPATAEPGVRALSDSCAAPFNNPRESPFAHREYITAVEPYKVTRSNGKRTTTELQGATIKIRAVAGLTAEWLQRLIEDHVAYLASSATVDMGWCPLALWGVNADVSSAGNGFAITINSKDGDTAKEVLRRGQALLTAVR